MDFFLYIFGNKNKRKESMNNIKISLLLSISFFLVGCGATTNYKILSHDHPYDALSFTEPLEAKTMQTKLGPFTISGGEAVETILLDENPGYDAIINPVYKTRVETVIPFLYTKQMVKITARLGKLK